MSIEIGQILWLKLKFNNEGMVSDTEHPYLVIHKNDDSTIEVGQLDKVRGKRWKLAYESNKLITKDEPNEAVISEDSFIQMDNKFQLDEYDGLEKYLRTTERLSESKLKDVIHAYELYQETHELDENKQVYHTKAEIEELNPEETS